MKTSRHRERIALRWIFRLSLLLGIAQLALVLISWLSAAAMPDWGVQSLISAGGIRWFFGNYSEMVATPWLVWLILCAVALGSMERSGLRYVLRTIATHGIKELSIQKVYALRLAMGLLLTEVGGVLLLTALPHAVLLSVTGDLFPSSFSQGLVPLLSFVVTSVSVVYGKLSGNLRTLYDVGQSLCASGKWLMPLLVLYIFLAQFVASCGYVFVLVEP
jgi:p-aminobenzoyl-glutamate transporter AbgT